MPFSLRRRLFPLVAAALVLPALAACSGSGLALTTQRVEGYVLREDQLAQIRPGQSQDLVTIVLGSPQTTNSFGDETAFYYVETKKESTAFGLDMIKERTVLAVYFDKNKKVVDKAIYGIQDGKVFQIESRKTPSFGEDRTFIESILKSFG
jgi:outer membrane protein assembly factor BamE (lipoprotein component of BamABCDE complex)